MKMVLVMSAVLALCGCADASRCAGRLVPINAAAAGSAQPSSRVHAKRSAGRERAQR